MSTHPYEFEPEARAAAADILAGSDIFDAVDEHEPRFRNQGERVANFPAYLMDVIAAVLGFENEPEA